MAQGKQAKTLTQKQQDAVLAYLERSTRHPQRNKVIFLLSMKAGLRAKEIASLRWRNVCDAEGYTSDEINIEDAGSKGKGGRTIPMAPALKEALQAYRNHLSLKALPGHDRRTRPWTDIPSKHDGVDIDGFIIRTERGSTISGVSAQVIVNLFQKWFGPEGYGLSKGHRLIQAGAPSSRMPPRRFPRLVEASGTCSSLAGHSLAANDTALHRRRSQKPRRRLCGSCRETAKCEGRKSCQEPNPDLVKLPK